MRKTNLNGLMEVSFCLFCSGMIATLLNFLFGLGWTVTFAIWIILSIWQMQTQTTYTRRNQKSYLLPIPIRYTEETEEGD